MTCPLCAHREQQLDRLNNEVLVLRLALAESEPTVAARQDLERVNQRLVEANTEIRNLKARLRARKTA